MCTEDVRSLAQENIDKNATLSSIFLKIKDATENGANSVLIKELNEHEAQDYSRLLEGLGYKTSRFLFPSFRTNSYTHRLNITW